MKWNELVKAQGPTSGAFLQSLEWAHLQSQTNRTVFYLASIDGQVQVLDETRVRQADNIDGLALAILMPISFGKKFLYIPRGPISKNAEQLIELAKQIAQKEKAIFIKIDPAFQIPNSKFQIPNLSSLQPEKTVILDLTKDPKELLAAMHTKTRYNIALARRHNVRVEKATADEQFNQWFELMSATARRDGFRAHPKSYYQKLLNINGDFKTTLWLAFLDNDLLAGNLIGYFNHTATYLHGASSNTKRNLMAPYLLHWEIILDAQKNNCTAYDFWGINEKKWPGITRFKQNFGDATTLREIQMPAAIDIPLNKFWYFLYKLKIALRSH